MADGRGGYQKPKKPASVSGPGKMSKRTDGKPQAVREPDIDTNRDLQYGDRSMLTQAQKVAPVPGGSPSPRFSGTPAAPGGQLPPWLMDMPSNRPGEPVTAGLDMGPGPGPEALQASEPAPDIREQALEALWTQFGNEQARQMLMQLRNERAAAVSQPVPFGGPLG